ncbi:MAG: alanine racemase [Desulfobacca sp.]|uniref:alanine racemase n=1 Tax=Desulfobacca sp. TaxID=2067990 RepID=UPI00404A165D
MLPTSPSEPETPSHWPTDMLELVIDLAALRANFRQLRQWCRADVKIMGVVKADAYGHGLVPVAKTLATAGVDYFGVAYLHEGLRLRQDGITLPILLLMGVLPSEAGAAVQADLEVALFRQDIAAALAAQARQQGKQARVHVKIDTGMGRLGILPTEVLSFLEFLAGLPELQVVGLISHLATADWLDQAYTLQQVREFDALLRQVRDRGWPVPASHIANSGALLALPHTHLDMVRAGLALYGSPPSEEVPSPVPLRPVMSLRSQVLQLKELPAGSSISYGRTYIAAQPIRLAALPVGYCNGYNRLLSNRGHVLIRGQRAPIRGRVCMNLTMVEVTHLPAIAPGVPVTLLGEDGPARLTAEELAAWAQTISYEVYCLLGNSNYRRYTGA